MDALLDLIPNLFPGWRMPEDISTYGESIDYLYYVILAITGAVFFLTEGLIVYTLIRFRYKAGQKAQYSHGNHKLELSWTIVTAFILVALAVAQIGIWEDVKSKIPDASDNPLTVQVLAKQYAWNFRYAGNDGTFETEDDVYSADLYIPVHRKVVVRMRSMDVIHSLFIPNMRFKQDIVPGMTITGWFEAKKTTQEARADPGRDPKFNYEIACAELCGVSHNTMGSLFVILEPAEFEKWHREESEEAPEFDVLPFWENWEKSVEVDIKTIEHKEEH